MAERVRARDVRARAVFDREITGLGLITFRRVDIVGLVMSGAIPMHLLQGMQELQGRVPELQSDPMAILSLPPEEAAAVYELLRRYACAACVDPVVVFHDDHNLDHLPVETLDSNQLLEIWSAAPPTSLVDAPAAKDFRGDAPAVPPDAPHDGGDVRPEAELVAAAGTVETITQ